MEEKKEDLSKMSPMELAEWEAKHSEAYYQATQDIGRGGMNPNEAFTRRGFVKNLRGQWVFKK